MFDQERLDKYVEAIKYSGLTIYESIDIGDPDLWIPSPELEAILDKYLKGNSLKGLPLRTRSKVLKEHVCRALGYPVPPSFKKVQPRFFGQQFDTYAQKSNNLQIWNEEISPTRRYVLAKISADDIITKVKVVTGDSLADLDSTGTLTQKFQARLIPNDNLTELISEVDTELLNPFIESDFVVNVATSPTEHPVGGQLLPIKEVYDKLKGVIGVQFPDAGHDQERNRGAGLHKIVCERLGYSFYSDDGQFPDVRHQLLEVKLQTSPTIDLGLVCPNSESPLDVPKINDTQIRHCDVRYALFYAETDGKIVTITNFYLSTGQDFFSRFPQFQGKVLNKKLQIPLPTNFFDS